MNVTAESGVGLNLIHAKFGVAHFSGAILGSAHPHVIPAQAGILDFASARMDSRLHGNDMDFPR